MLEQEPRPEVQARPERFHRRVDILDDVGNLNDPIERLSPIPDWHSSAPFVQFSWKSLNLSRNADLRFLPVAVSGMCSTVMSASGNHHLATRLVRYSGIS